jgi:hypothetical protein
VRPAKKKALIVEFIGASGVGKSTLIPAVADYLGARGQRVGGAEEFILASYGLHVRPGLLRAALVHLLCVKPFLSFFFTSVGFRFTRFALRLIVRDAGGMRIGISLARCILQRVGVHLLLERLGQQPGAPDVIICDEGMVHAVHNLFVHAGTPPSAAEIAQFEEMVPKSDVLIWVTAPASRLVAVLLQRGHTRVAPTQAAAASFVANAATAFEILAAIPDIGRTLCQVENATPAGGWTGSPAPETVETIGEFIVQRLQCDAPDPALCACASAPSEPVRLHE